LILNIFNSFDADVNQRLWGADFFMLQAIPLHYNTVNID